MSWCKSVKFDDFNEVPKKCKKVDFSWFSMCMNFMRFNDVIKLTIQWCDVRLRTKKKLEEWGVKRRGTAKCCKTLIKFNSKKSKTGSGTGGNRAAHPECPAGMRTGSWNCMRSMITRTHGIMSLCVRNFSDSESRVASVTKWCECWRRRVGGKNFRWGIFWSDKSFMACTWERCDALCCYIGRVSTMMCPNLCEENLFSELCVDMMMKWTQWTTRRDVITASAGKVVTGLRVLGVSRRDANWCEWAGEKVSVEGSFAADDNAELCVTNSCVNMTMCCSKEAVRNCVLDKSQTCLCCVLPWW